MSIKMDHEKVFDELVCILDRDDKESFVEFLRAHPEIIGEYLVSICATSSSKKCLTTMVNEEACEQLPQLKGWARCIHTVSCFFPDPDVISIMLERGAIVECNIKRDVGFLQNYGTPLYLLLDHFSCERDLPLQSWSEGDSIFKLIILLCSWESNGKLKQLAALLLVAREEVMRPTGTGMTIQQHVTNEIDGLGSEVDSDHQYKSMLMDARGAIPPEKVLMDVAALLKKAGFSLQSADLDLRDCYRKLCFASNIGLTGNVVSFGRQTCLSYQAHWDPLLARLTSREVLNLCPSVPASRLLSTAAGSNLPRKNYLAYVALKLRRGIRFL
uniref:Uncharacterized protein n=1 Tax=Chenopodium quinoa TaxID=63459 RepID=A0A803MK95_CHEQI